MTNTEEPLNPNEPPLRLGNVVRLNSGGPTCMVVDFGADTDIVVAWLDENAAAREWTFPRTCVHRVSLC